MKPYSESDALKLQTNLAAIRKIAGWTAADLGELIGVTKQTISNLETGKSTMTKTQYIAIRAVVDYEISSNPENTILPQVISILLDSDEIGEEDQAKVDTTIAYVTGAKEKGMTTATISAGLTALAAALGLICGPISGAIAAGGAAPHWLEAINASKKKKI